MFKLRFKILFNKYSFQCTKGMLILRSHSYELKKVAHRCERRREEMLFSSPTLVCYFFVCSRKRERGMSAPKWLKT